jgi:hypothetical protein
MNALPYFTAVEHVLANKNVAFATLPQVRAGKQVGAEVYVIEYCENHKTEPDEYPPYRVHYTAGLFNSSSGEGEIYWPDEVPPEAITLTYTPIPPAGATRLDREIQLVIEDLEKAAASLPRTP